jgi:hypothetical protein
MGVLKVGGDDDGSRLIIVDCMAQYCNYWCKRKSPIDGNVIVDVLAGWWGAGGRSGRHHGWGGSSTPLLNNQHWIGRSTNTTQQSTIFWL